MIGRDFAWKITCVDSKRLTPDFAGRDFGAPLPEDVDPCGEKRRVSFFRLCGPMFREPIPITPGERLERDRFIFADLLLQEPFDAREENPPRIDSDGWK